MSDVSAGRLLLRRLAQEWTLLLIAFTGVLVACVLVSGSPIFLDSLDRLSFNRELDQKVGEYLNINIFVSRVPLTRAAIQGNEDALNYAIEEHFAEARTTQERFLKTGTFLTGLSTFPLPEQPHSGRIVSRGHFQSLTHLESNARFIEGRMATDKVGAGDRGPTIEAVISEPTAQRFDLVLGSLVTMTPTIAHPQRITAEIVGVLEPDDSKSEFWRYPSLFLDPGAILERPDPGVTVRQEPPVALFVEDDIFVDVVGKTYPGSLAVPFWFILADTDYLKRWSLSEVQRRLEGFEKEIVKSMPGSDFLTGGFVGIVEELNRKSLINRLPILVFLVMMVATLLSCVVMVASCLGQKRERDFAMIRTRGGSTFQVLQLYGLEAFLLSITAVVIAPFLAMGAVAMAGKLPYFTQSTGGSMLPVELTLTPFLAALGVGGLCLAILLVPCLLSGRSGLALHRLRSSRPPTVPFFHRYYLDGALLVLGTIVFWELNARRQLVSKGLSNEIQINETLLLAPALFLIVAGLVFVRIFPFIVRFVSGESATLVHFLSVAVSAVLVSMVGVQEMREEGVWHAVVQVAPLLVLGALYFATVRMRRLTSRLALVMTQAGVVALFVYQRTSESGEVFLIPALALIGIVCAQLLFMCLEVLARSAPVWLSVGLWKMTRNPLQYTWLMVLLLLATGLGVLSATVSGTLDQNQRDKIRYDVAADVRVSNISFNSHVTPSDIEAALIENPGVAGAAKAYRDKGNFESVGFSLLGLEAAKFVQLSWYRPDFSKITLGEAMTALQPAGFAEPILVPEDATHVGLWVRPEERHSGLFVWVVLGDGSGQLRTVSLGQIDRLEWQMLEVEIPSELAHPRRVVSVQVFEPAGRLMSLGPFASQVKGTPGIVHFDDIFTRGIPENGRVVLEDFEGVMSWNTIVTGASKPDRILVTDDAFHGQASATFSFGADRNRLVRGFYRGLAGDAVPAVVSRSFLAASGLSKGDEFMARATNRLIPFVVVDIVEYFPTLSPEGGGFVIVDLDSLLYHMNLVSEQTQVAPNEIYVNALPGTEKTTLDKTRHLVTAAGSVEGIYELIDSFDNDPLRGVGLRALVFFALGVFVISLGLGYLSFFLSSREQRIAEAGILKTIGISRAQLVSLFAVENGSLVISGIAVGTWVGLQMSSWMVSALSVTKEADISPPVVVTTDWVLILLAFMGLALAIAASLLIVNRDMLRFDFKEFSRLTG